MREDDTFVPPSGKVTNARSYASIPPCRAQFAYSYAGSSNRDAAFKTSRKEFCMSVLRQLF
jgi:hypothetical protein